MMRSKVEKEILTKEKCIQDLLLPMRDIRSRWLAMLLIMLPLGLFFGFMAIIAPDTTARVLVLGAYSGLLLIVGILLVDDSLRIRRKKRRIMEGKFHIEEAVLAGIAENAYHHRPTRYDSGRRDRLDFSDRRFFFLDVETRKERRCFTYYKWSSRYYMTSEGILHTSQLGDTFYLLVYDDDPERKPIMVYNAKFFDYNKELWENV